MTPSAVAIVAFSLCGIDNGVAYTSLPINKSSSRRRHVGLMSSTASGFGEGGKIVSNAAPPLGSNTLTSNPYIRIKKRGRHYDVQTSITTFQKTTISNDDMDESATKTTVDLHAQIHFGDASYFDYFNGDSSCASYYDKILYELIVEDKFLRSSSTTTSSTGANLKQLTPMSGTNQNPIAPTQSDRNTAQQYGLQCQVDGIQYCKEDWVHADLTREEFISWLEYSEKEKQSSQAGNSKQGMQQQEQPLWALASTAATYPGSELVTSLLRPLTTTSSNSASAALTRRLFTHLFLPGDALSGWIRAILWLGVPSPELSIMLVDWSSLSYIGRQSFRRRGSSADSKRDDTNNIAPISPIAAPVSLSLLTGNWGTARRLVFGQVLASGQSNADTSKGGVLIEKRNERAMKTLRESLSSLEEKESKRIALLYGAGHCRDLHRRLVQEEGMTPIRTEWRTAFRATAPRWGDAVDMNEFQAMSRDIASNLPSSVIDGEGIVKSMSVSTLESVAVGLVILPLYLLVGGFDWVATVNDLGTALDGGMYIDGIASVLLYLVRHVALYVGISKFVVDWGGSEGIFEDDERA